MTALHLRVRLGGGRVDGDDEGVRERAAQDRTVEHAGQVEIVDVVALAPQEPGVFLAQHAAEADRVAAGCTGGVSVTVIAVRSFFVTPRVRRRMFGGPPNGPHDVLVAGAAADVAADGLTDVASSGFGS